MKKNVGNIERWLRILFGAAIITTGIYFQSWLGVIGIIPIITGSIGNCPLYSIFGFSTCKVREKAAG